MRIMSMLKVKGLFNSQNQIIGESFVLKPEMRNSFIETNDLQMQLLNVKFADLACSSIGRLHKLQGCLGYQAPSKPKDCTFGKPRAKRVPPEVADAANVRLGLLDYFCTRQDELVNGIISIISLMRSAMRSPYTWDI